MFAVTAEPLWVRVVFHELVTVCPAGHDHVSDQLDSASPRLVIATLAPKPPCYCEETA